MGSMNIPSGNPAKNSVESYPPFLQRSPLVAASTAVSSQSPEPRLVHDLSETLSSLHQQAFGSNESSLAQLQGLQVDQPLVYSSPETRLAAQEADDFLMRFAPTA